MFRLVRFRTIRAGLRRGRVSFVYNTHNVVNLLFIYRSFPIRITNSRQLEIYLRYNILFIIVIKLQYVCRRRMFYSRYRNIIFRNF